MGGPSRFFNTSSITIESTLAKPLLCYLHQTLTLVTATISVCELPFLFGSVSSDHLCGCWRVYAQVFPFAGTDLIPSYHPSISSIMLGNTLSSTSLWDTPCCSKWRPITLLLPGHINLNLFFVNKDITHIDPMKRYRVIINGSPLGMS